MSGRARILIVDDEAGIRESLSGMLEDEGYEVESAASGEEALALFDGGGVFALALLDIWLPGMDGIAVLERIRALDPAVRPEVVAISGHGTVETAVRATKLGAFDFLEKPLGYDKVAVTVRNALEHRRLERQNRSLREQFEPRYRILGDSVPMKALRRQIELMAPTNGRVLIYGESGVGKELIARAIHAQSLRADEPFVEVNCAAIPEETIESELFGHVKGARAGATEDKPGKFQQAHGGTLFLDEVGDMSLATQARVLRALEEQRFEPVGSGRAVQVDSRAIAATNKDLDEEIAKGNFREDLFYRLNVVPVFVPPLRQRAEDVTTLARHFLDEFCAAYGRKSKRLTQAAERMLTEYSWPGNVRELRNMMERIVIMEPESVVDARRLPLPDGGRRKARPAAGFATLDEARKAYERDYVLKTLDAENGNMTRTAEVLGLERSHLYRKMKALGIAPGEARE